MEIGVIIFIGHRFVENDTCNGTRDDCYINGI